MSNIVNPKLFRIKYTYSFDLTSLSKNLFSDFLDLKLTLIQDYIKLYFFKYNKNILKRTLLYLYNLKLSLKFYNFIAILMFKKSKFLKKIIKYRLKKIKKSLYSGSRKSKLRKKLKNLIFKRLSCVNFYKCKFRLKRIVRLRLVKSKYLFKNRKKTRSRLRKKKVKLYKKPKKIRKSKFKIKRFVKKITLKRRTYAEFKESERKGLKNLTKFIFPTEIVKIKYLNLYKRRKKKLSSKKLINERNKNIFFKLRRLNKKVKIISYIKNIKFLKFKKNINKKYFKKKRYISRYKKFVKHSLYTIGSNFFDIKIKNQSFKNYYFHKFKPVKLTLKKRLFRRFYYKNGFLIKKKLFKPFFKDPLKDTRYNWKTDKYGGWGPIKKPKKPNFKKKYKKKLKNTFSYLNKYLYNKRKLRRFALKWFKKLDLKNKRKKNIYYFFRYRNKSCRVMFHEIKKRKKRYIKPLLKKLYSDIEIIKLLNTKYYSLMSKKFDNSFFINNLKRVINRKKTIMKKYIFIKRYTRFKITKLKLHDKNIEVLYKGKDKNFYKRRRKFNFYIKRNSIKMRKKIKLKKFKILRKLTLNRKIKLNFKKFKRKSSKKKIKKLSLLKKFLKKKKIVYYKNYIILKTVLGSNFNKRKIKLATFTNKISKKSRNIKFKRKKIKFRNKNKKYLFTKNKFRKKLKKKKPLKFAFSLLVKLFINHKLLSFKAIFTKSIAKFFENKIFFKFFLIFLKSWGKIKTADMFAEAIILNLLKKIKIKGIIKGVLRFFKLYFRRKRIGGFLILFTGRFTRKDRAMYSWHSIGKYTRSNRIVIIDYSNRRVPLKYSSCSFKINLIKSVYK